MLQAIAAILENLAASGVVLGGGRVSDFIHSANAEVSIACNDALLDAARRTLPEATPDEVEWLASAFANILGDPETGAALASGTSGPSQAPEEEFASRLLAALPRQFCRDMSGAQIHADVPAFVVAFGECFWDRLRQSAEDPKSRLANRVARREHDELLVEVRDLSERQATDSEAFHQEARRIRQDVAALRADALAPPTRYVFIDVMRAPDSVRRAMTELGKTAPAEAGWLQERFEAEHPGDVAAQLVVDPPTEAREGSAVLWACIARYAEHAGEWGVATDAWIRAGQRPGGGQVASMVNAAIAAYVAGDDDRYRALVDGAEAIEPGHPRVRLERVAHIAEPQERLTALQLLSFDSADLRALVACQQALACLQLGRIAEAETYLRKAVAEHGGLLQVRMTRLNVEVENARAAIRAGQEPDAKQMRRAEKDATEVRARLIEQRRWQESAAALTLMSDASFLAGDSQRAISVAEEAAAEELATSDGRAVILELASRIGAHNLVVRLLPEPADDEEARIRAGSLAIVGSASQQQEAMSTLDRLAGRDDAVGEHAALTRVLLTVFRPGFGWPPSSARRLEGTQHEDFAVSANAVWLAVQRRWDDAEALLARYPQEDLWVIQARFDAMQSHPDPAIRQAAASRLLRTAPEASTRLSCGVTLWAAGDADRGEAEVRAVATNVNASIYPRTEAYRCLVANAIDAGDGRGALRLLDGWDRLHPGSPHASALRVRASALLRRGDRS